MQQIQSDTQLSHLKGDSGKFLKIKAHSNSECPNSDKCRREICPKFQIVCMQIHNQDSCDEFEQVYSVPGLVQGQKRLN